MYILYNEKTVQVSVDTVDPVPEGMELIQCATPVELEPLASLKTLATMHNIVNKIVGDGKQVKKFENKKVAARRVFPLLARMLQAVRSGKPATKAKAKPKAKSAPATGDKKGSPAKGKRLGIGKYIEDCIAQEKSTADILTAVHSRFPESRAKANDVSIARRRLKDKLETEATLANAA